MDYTMTRRLWQFDSEHNLPVYVILSPLEASRGSMQTPLNGGARILKSVQHLVTAD